MDIGQHTVAHFVVLFTAQKFKKFKTWQDGTMKYYSFNRKLVLVDEKGYNIDKKFSKTGAPNVGDEIEFEGHLVTVESFESEEPYANQAVPQPVGARNAIRESELVQNRLPQASHLQPTSEDSGRDTRISAVGGYRFSRKRLRVSNLHQQNMSFHKNLPPHPATMSNASTDLPSLRQNSYTPRFVRHPTTDNTSTIQSNDEQIQHQNVYAPPVVNAAMHTNISASVPNISTTASTDRLRTEERNVTVDITNDRATSISVNASSIDQTSKSNPTTEAGNSSNTARATNSTHCVPTLSTSNVVATTQSNAARGRTSDTEIDGVSNGTRTSPIQKRVRIGLSKRSISKLHSGATLSPEGKDDSAGAIRNEGSTESTTAPGQVAGSFVSASSIRENASASSSRSEGNSSSLSLSKPFKIPLAEGVSVPSVLQFPSLDRAMALVKSRKSPKRTRTIPTRFSNVAQYKDIFRRAIHEHLQILLLNYGVYYYSLYKTFSSNGQSNLERSLRSKGLGFYASCNLQCDSRFQAQPRFRLEISNREHHSKYSKDDVWAISKSPKFDPSTTFLARSTYYGPSSGGTVEIECVTPRDERVASNLAASRESLVALRTISASAEFMMLETLDSNLDNLPLLPFLLNDGKSKKRKADDAVNYDTPQYIRLTREDNINVEKKLEEYINRYHLNEDQQTVLRQVAKSVIIAPGWNEESGNPIMLVHGVFGSGKSYLAAVLIIFLRDIVDTACNRRESDEMIVFRILVSSMTNVAVDRILMSLAELGYDNFVRVGSIKKIAKSILPYTAQAKLSSKEELKELEEMLEDPQNSEEDNEHIATAIQKFRRNENATMVQTADVVGTTCMASTFEVFGSSTFALALVDEASQLMEPLTMVPMVKFGCGRLLMIGDPLQLPPTLTTVAAEDDKVGQGLDKTLFDRLTEMGHQSIMLRTQYRCHPKISAISNRLFYGMRLLNGIRHDDRAPLIDGLSNLLFVDIAGQEQRSPWTNSFYNETEMLTAAHIIEKLISMGLSASDIGVISLYKEQADRLSEYLGSSLANMKMKKSIQISTVDAFQGGEKEVIILSTVRTTSSTFIDNRPRVNVAITRAKRHLIILGKLELLVHNELWSKIIDHCQDSSLTGHDLVQLLARLEQTNGQKTE